MKKGFTLVELMVIIVIIGILAALAIPKLRDNDAKNAIQRMKDKVQNIDLNTSHVHDTIHDTIYHSKPSW